MAFSRKIIAGVFMASAGVNVIGTVSESAAFGSSKAAGFTLTAEDIYRDWMKKCDEAKRMLGRLADGKMRTEILELMGRVEAQYMRSRRSRQDATAFGMEMDKIIKEVDYQCGIQENKLNDAKRVVLGKMDDLAAEQRLAGLPAEECEPINQALGDLDEMLGAAMSSSEIDRCSKILENIKEKWERTKTEFFKRQQADAERALKEFKRVNGESINELRKIAASLPSGSSWKKDCYEEIDGLEPQLAKVVSIEDQQYFSSLILRTTKMVEEMKDSAVKEEELKLKKAAAKEDMFRFLNPDDRLEMAKNSQLAIEKVYVGNEQGLSSFVNVIRDVSTCVSTKSRAKPVPALAVFGVPGTGKTMLGKVAAAKTGANLLVLTPNDFAGLSDENIRKKLDDTVNLAESVSKSSGNVSIVQIDEVDSVFRAGTSASKMLTSLLDRRKAMGSNNGVVFLMTGNHRGSIAPEIIRRGRVKSVVEFNGLSAKDKLRMVKNLTDRCNTSNVDWGAVFRLIESMTPAEVQDMVERVVIPKLQDIPDVGAPLEVTLTTNDFVEAAAE